MKKGFLLLSLLLFLVSSFAFGQYRKIVLLEEFTNASCPPCAQLNPGLHEFISHNYGSVISLRHHAWWPGNDPMYDLNTEDNNARIAYYEVWYVPWAQIDGSFFGEPADMELLKKLALAEQANGSPVKISVTDNSTETDINATVTLEGIENVTQSNLKLYVSVMERMVVYDQAPGSNGEKDFADVMRKYLPNTDGTPIPVKKSADPLIFDFTTPIDAEWNPDDLVIVAWVQSDDTKEIIQSNISIPTFVIASDDPDEELIAPNSTIVKNYSINNDNLTPLNLLLKTNVNLLQEGWTHSLIYNNQHGDQFNVTINPGETLNFSLEVITNDQEGEVDLEIFAQNTDDYLGYGNNINYYGVIQSGILVWDANDKGLDVSGNYISELLSRLNLDVKYTLDFPRVLDGFNAAFLSFGNSGNVGKYLNFDDDKAAVVEKYLLSGGNVYIEGGRVWGVDQASNQNLKELFGLGAAAGNTTNILDMLTGQNNSLAEGMVFHSSSQVSQKDIDKFTASGTGESAFIESNYGTVAVQNSGVKGQKSFCFSYSLAGLDDGTDRSKRESLVAAILKFFGIEFPSLAIDYNVEQNSAHAPFTAHFSDKTFTDPDFPINSWKWDFDNDGTVDSEEQNPEWTYNSPGIFTVNLEVSTAAQTLNLTRENYIKIFNGESSLLFSEEENYANTAVGPVMKLNDMFTFEAWFKPLAWGKSSEMTSTIADKKAFSLFLAENISGYNPNSAVLVIKSQSNADYYFNTPSNSVVLNEWQYIAANYNGSTGSVNVYINGIKQTLTSSGSVTGVLTNNLLSPLVIGNLIDHTNSFNGNIDEVRLWKIVRTDEEISANYNKYIAGNEEGLVGCWRFNEAFGNQLSDASPNNNNMQAFGSEWDFGAPLEGTVGIHEEDNNSMPIEFVLYDNYPNPFNPSTTIRYDVASTARINLKIYDILGREVATLVDEIKNGGRYSVVWNGQNNFNSVVASGVYLCKLSIESDNGPIMLTKKLILMK